jgi:transcriptional regulator with XRE-family HTH domain
MPRKLKRAQIKARVMRALSGLSQEDFELIAGVEGVAAFENGTRSPRPEQLERMAFAARMTTEDCEEIVQMYEAAVARRQGEDQARRRISRGPALGISGIIEEFEARFRDPVSDRSLRRAAEREAAQEAWERLAELAFEDMAVVARTARELQTWAMVERICDESARAVPKSAERSRNLAGLAVELAERVRAAGSWQRRVLGYALAHLANAQSASGDPDAARESLARAETYWYSGDDPDQVLDAGRFLALGASVSLAEPL